MLFLALNGCGKGLTVIPTPPAFTATIPSPTIKPELSTPIPTEKIIGKNITVFNAEDSGQGTLRQALLDAEKGDTISFDPKIFPPDNPTTIFLKVENQDVALPEISQGYLTIDASNAGVIIDGSETRGMWVNCIMIRSDWNVIQGLQIINFPGSGISIMGGAKHNTIGGDRNIGSGPLGQGNLSSGNRTGIDLQGYNTSNNTVLGNIIGANVDGSHSWSNQDTGLYITNGASNNKIGPNNHFTFNSFGIQISEPYSHNNIVTQNSIHDNSLIGIYHIRGEEDYYTNVPSIIGYDISEGSITLYTCPLCTVEVYSDKGTQGEFFEIRGATDYTGIITLDKGSPFSGPHLTAIAIEKNKNTSEFSFPTTGDSQPAMDVLSSKLIQSENDLPMLELVSKRSSELEDSRIGTFTCSLWHPEPEIYRDMTLDPRNIIDMGIKRFRLTINGLETPSIDWNKPEFTIEPSHDEFITKLVNNGIKITYVLSFWDTDWVAQGNAPAIPRFKTEEEIQRYLEYVQFTVHHFKDRIEYYEIWNEPDHPNPDNTPQLINVEDYVKLVTQIVPVIRKEYPEAKIVVGGTTSLIDKDSQTYLFKVLESEVMPLVDVISWHPMYGSSPEYDWHKQYYYEYPSLVRKIKDTASIHGFKGEYVADEIHWPTPSNPEQGWPVYSNIQSIKYLTRSIIMHLGMDISVTQLLLMNNPQLYRTNAYLSTVFAGNKATNIQVIIQSEAANATSYSFSLPNGDNLIALWNDGIAVDFDPGIPSELTIPGYGEWSASGIDVLNGYEQQLVVSNENGDLIIQGFLLKDYPIIIRLYQ